MKIRRFPFKFWQIKERCKTIPKLKYLVYNQLCYLNTESSYFTFMKCNKPTKNRRNSEAHNQSSKQRSFVIEIDLIIISYGDNDL